MRIMKTTLSISAFLFPLILTAGLAAADDESPPEAKELFLANKCNLCHSIDSYEVVRKTKSEKIKGPDLSDVGSRHAADWIAGFLNRLELLNDKRHKKEFKGAPKEAQELAEWLASLEAPSGEQSAAGR